MQNGAKHFGGLDREAVRTLDHPDSGGVALSLLQA